MILIVSRSKKLANTVTEIFYYMGIISHSATPSEALSEISPLYRSVLVMDPETLPDPKEFVKRLRSYASNVPIFCISEAGNKNPYSDLFDGSFKHAISSAILASKMAQISKKASKPYIGDYRLSGINATCDQQFVTYFSTPVMLTKTESMILRYLIRTYPLPQKASNILKYAFRPSRHPEVESIKTHISLINKKFRAIDNRNDGRRLISTYNGEGYLIFTPEIVSKIKRKENVQV